MRDAHRHVVAISGMDDDDEKRFRSIQGTSERGSEI